jgi:hypothetical protein
MFRVHGSHGLNRVYDLGTPNLMPPEPVEKPAAA